MKYLRRVPGAGPVNFEVSPDVTSLVKFARLTPTEPECATALQEAQIIVERTVPPPTPAGAPAAPPAASPEDEEAQDG